jgi:hypothetical protein
MDIKGIIAHTPLKKTFQKNPLKYFCIYLSIEKTIHTKKAQISNSYLISLTNLAFLTLKKIILRF